MSRNWAVAMGASRLAAVRRGLALVEDALARAGGGPTAPTTTAPSPRDIPLAMALLHRFLVLPTASCNAILPAAASANTPNDRVAAVVDAATASPLPSRIEQADDAGAAFAEALRRLARLPRHEKERMVVNAVAQRLGLPERFQWPVEAVGAASSGAVPTPADARSFLWAPAVQTSLGPQALPISSSTTTATTGGSSLLQANADSLFSFNSSSVPTQTTQQRGLRGRQHRQHGNREGGGVLHASTMESYLCLLHTAKTQALSRCEAATTGAGTLPSALSTWESRQRQLQRLVLYCSDQTDPLLLRAAALVGIPHTRVMQTVLIGHSVGSGGETAMYRLDVRELKKKIVEDLGAGLFPCLVVGTFGSALTASVDPLEELASFCAKTGVWFHIDASHGGAFLLSCSSPDDQLAPRHCSAAAATTSSSSSEGSCGAAGSRQRRSLARDCHRAAALADSIQFTASAVSSGLPFSLLPSTGPSPAAGVGDGEDLSLLFLSHLPKVRWSLHALDSTRQASANHFTTASAMGSVDAAEAAEGGGTATSDVCGEDYLRLVDCRSSSAAVAAVLDCSLLSLWLRGAAPAAAARGSQEAHAFAPCEEVAAHQQLLFAVQSALQGDGLFDCALPAAPLFGRVYVRLLTYADETTAALARHIAAHVSSSEDASAGGHVARGVVGGRLSCSLVVVQHRLWVCLSMSAVQEEEAADGDGQAAACRTRAAAAAAAVTRAVEVVRRSADAVLSQSPR